MLPVWTHGHKSEQQQLSNAAATQHTRRQCGQPVRDQLVSKVEHLAAKEPYMFLMA